VVAIYAPQALHSFFVSQGAFVLTSTGLSLTAGAGFASAAITGFAVGLVGSGGNLKAGLIGAFTAGLFNLAGGIGEAASLERYAAHATAGCISSVAGGGKCGQGAVAAVFGKYSTNWISESGAIQGDFAKGVASSIAGGVGSVIAGGKFENGAVTAAFGYLFNHMSARGLRDFFRSVSAAGHHFVPYVVSAEAGVSMDAAREFSKAGTGIIPDYGNSDNPHRGHTKAHAEYDKAVRSELDSYLKSQDTTASKMTTDQAKEFVQRIRTSQVPEIKNFNMAIRAHILNNALKLAPPRGD
jgi:hypothetical protein